MMIKGIRRREFRKAIVGYSGGCTVQHDGWPCGTCFPFPHDAWLAVLAYRGDYEDRRQGDVYRLATDIVYKPDGTFSHHVFTEITRAELARRVLLLWARIKPKAVRP